MIDVGGGDGVCAGGVDTVGGIVHTIVPVVGAAVASSSCKRGIFTLANACVSVDLNLWQFVDGETE